MCSMYAYLNFPAWDTTSTYISSLFNLSARVNADFCQKLPIDSDSLKL